MVSLNRYGYQSSFITAGILLIAGAALTLLLKPQPKSGAGVPEPALAK
ncbi:MAG: hypothetical protein ABSC89_10695 [Verrucomicrobiota bacterium]